VRTVDGHDLVPCSRQHDRDQLTYSRLVFDDEHRRVRPESGGRDARCDCGVRCRGQLDVPAIRPTTSEVSFLVMSRRVSR